MPLSNLVLFLQKTHAHNNYPHVWSGKLCVYILLSCGFREVVGEEEFYVNPVVMTEDFIVSRPSSNSQSLYTVSCTIRTTYVQYIMS